MAFQKIGAYAGIEDHVPAEKNPPPPLGLHKVRIIKAMRFEGFKAETTVAEMMILESEKRQDLEGTVCGWVRTLDKRYPQYYLGDVRGFVAAVLNKKIGEVDGQMATEAIGDRDNGTEGTTKGCEVYIMVSDNEKDPRYPNIKFIAA